MLQMVGQRRVKIQEAVLYGDEKEEYLGDHSIRGLLLWSLKMQVGTTREKRKQENKKK